VHAAFQDVEDRLPVHAGRSHGDVRDHVLGQPVRERQQVARAWQSCYVSLNRAHPRSRSGNRAVEPL
jgi:hypothetical protein